MEPKTTVAGFAQAANMTRVPSAQGAGRDLSLLGRASRMCGRRPAPSRPPWWRTAEFLTGAEGVEPIGERNQDSETGWQSNG